MKENAYSTVKGLIVGLTFGLMIWLLAIWSLWVLSG